MIKNFFVLKKNHTFAVEDCINAQIIIYNEKKFICYRSFSS